MHAQAPPVQLALMHASPHAPRAPHAQVRNRVPPVHRPASPPLCAPTCMSRAPCMRPAPCATARLTSESWPSQPAENKEKSTVTIVSYYYLFDICELTFSTCRGATLPALHVSQAAPHLPAGRIVSYYFKGMQHQSTGHSGCHTGHSGSTTPSCQIGPLSHTHQLYCLQLAGVVLLEAGPLTVQVLAMQLVHDVNLRGVGGEWLLRGVGGRGVGERCAGACHMYHMRYFSHAR